jgi:hypothetical protein
VGYGPYNEYNRNFTWFDNATWIRGRHTWKFGLDVHRYNKTENASSQQGTFSFTHTGAPSGTSSFQQGWANFLLGNVSTFSMPSTDITPNLWAWQHDAFAQDDFKVTPHLTLFLGVRWSFFGQPKDDTRVLDNFDPAAFNSANAPKIDPATGNVIAGTGNNWQMNGIIIAGQNSAFGDRVANNVYKNFAPRQSRLGSFQRRQNQHPRRLRHLLRLRPVRQLRAELVRRPALRFQRDQRELLQRRRGYGRYQPPGPQRYHRPGPARHAGCLADPYLQQWSFHLQRSLSRNLVLEVAYAGTKGTHLLGIVDINEAYPGAAYAAGLHRPNGNTIFTSTVPRINSVRRFPGFTYINALETAFDSNYNALQTQLRKNFGAGGQFNLSYTRSKYFTDNRSDRSNAPQNSYNWHEGEYGPPGDRQHVLTFNYIYELPIFRGSKGFVGGALKGWQFSGLGAFYTGAPFKVTTSGFDPAGLGNIGNNSAASGRPDMICDPNASAPHHYGGSAQSSGQNLTWFNTACFAPVPQGAIRPGTPDAAPFAARVSPTWT